MSISYTFLDNGKGFELVFKDVAKGRDLIDTLKDLYRKMDPSALEYQIINKKDCTEYLVTAEDLETIAAIDKQFFKQAKKIKVAIIESSHLLFNLTELWQAHLEGHFEVIERFPNRESALKWVKPIP